MTQQGVRWTADQVLALAPDAASRKAGSKLGAAGPWSEAGSSEEGTVWGLCKGSGSKPYQTVIDIADAAGPAYKCSCPSRKFPCKHALGLLLLWAGGEGAVAPGPAPDWAEQWIEGRRQRAQEKRAAGAAGAAAGSGDPEGARRRAERRAVRITAGATELEQRLADLLRGGLAGAEQAGYGLWEETAARMVDAQAPGLAARVRELGAIPSSGPGWPVRLLEECALIHLLDQGWLRRERLPDGLASTVRSRIGLPASPDGPPLRDRWLVLAQYDTADSRLTTRRIWLHGTDSGRTALLLSYGAAGRAPELALPVGLELEAEVSAYHGTGQLRAALGEQFAPPAPSATRPPGVSTEQAAARYGEALRDDPWLDSVPVTLDRVIPAPDGDSWQLADADGDSALPLTPSARSRPGLWRLVALSGGTPVKVFGECGHRGFTPLTAWPEGTGEAVQLC
ncbi:SWIM zinc finger family protein [Streptomyces griseorubiginosus]|uniref:SWIM zinc finger family protein n=1 Tax=Streptomyces griseorubiginosus TaxID=67304 RepID=UPI002E7FC83F|nr:SWIM zinc finger family protein [Streptomyces griseorubiginosus]WUB44847.1 SWIM zinc finger family protein [Streptomyces griseorubiginosus]WUB53364.1 SWIM zinc finger family protein [Streptomyces griseorubiginosus]